MIEIILLNKISNSKQNYTENFKLPFLIRTFNLQTTPTERL